MKTYQLHAETEAAADGNVRTLKVYRRQSVAFMAAAGKRRGVDVSYVEKDGFEVTLRGDPDEIERVERDFNSRHRK